MQRPAARVAGKNGQIEIQELRLQIREAAPTPIGPGFCGVENRAVASLTSTTNPTRMLKEQLCGFRKRKCSPNDVFLQNGADPFSGGVQFLENDAQHSVFLAQFIRGNVHRDWRWLPFQVQLNPHRLLACVDRELPNDAKCFDLAVDEGF